MRKTKLEQLLAKAIGGAIKFSVGVVMAIAAGPGKLSPRRSRG
jgi:hypothetical protein